MKKNYIYPRITVRKIDTELIIAGSDTLERGSDGDSGGNNAEVKSQYRFTGHTNPVNWDE